MKKLSKLQINPERIMKNEELKILRGGDYDSGCGNYTEWFCDVHYDGVYAFSGIACGTQEYISAVCQQLSYECSCTQTWTPLPIIN
ncbi:MAG TPA: hypothetical protein DFI01_02300 [Bacteroidales bacterium]|nr:hypothetical protein [Bacteroidales bacterium]